MQNEPSTFEPFLDLESDVNAALVKYPYGYAEFQGSRFGRERYAKMFLEMVIADRAKKPKADLKEIADKLRLIAAALEITL